MKKQLATLLAVTALGIGVLSGCGVSAASSSTGSSSDSAGAIEITNVSYDPTRELYAAYNDLFAKHWKDRTYQWCSPTEVQESRRLRLQMDFRPSDQDILKQFEYQGQSNTISELPQDGKWIITNVDLTDISHFGGWTEASKKHFADGGLFDSIYEEKN